MKRWLMLYVLFFASNTYCQTIVIAYSNDSFPPYIVGTGSTTSNDFPGVSIEVLRQVANQLDIELIFVRAPWPRVLAMAKHNKVDAVFHASYKVDRAQYLQYPIQDGKLDSAKYLKRQQYFLYKRKESTIYSKDGKLYNVDGDIGVVISYAVAEPLKAQGIQVREVDTSAKGLALLSKGRLSGWVGLETSNDKILFESVDYQHILKDQLPLSSKPSYLAFSKAFYAKHSSLAWAFWEGIQRVTADEEYVRLLGKYHSY